MLCPLPKKVSAKVAEMNQHVKNYRELSMDRQNSDSNSGTKEPKTILSAVTLDDPTSYTFRNLKKKQSTPLSSYNNLARAAREFSFAPSDS